MQQPTCKRGLPGRKRHPSELRCQDPGSRLLRTVTAWLCTSKCSETLVREERGRVAVVTEPCWSEGLQSHQSWAAFAQKAGLPAGTGRMLVQPAWGTLPFAQPQGCCWPLCMTPGSAGQPARRPAALGMDALVGAAHVRLVTEQESK